VGNADTTIISTEDIPGRLFRMAQGKACHPPLPQGETPAPFFLLTAGDHDAAVHDAKSAVESG